MTTMSVAQALAGRVPEGGQVTVRGWVRTRRDSKAGLSFVNVSDGSCFAPVQVVAPSTLPNYEDEVKRLSAGCAGDPAAEVVETASPCATSFAAAVSSPERCICQLSWSRTQPEYIAKRGTSGISVSIDSDGSVQPPEWNSWV